MTTRIELTGRLIRKPVMRVTPAGTATLSLELDCSENHEALVLKVVRVGAEAAELARQLRQGSRVRATGKLRLGRASAGPGTKIEVLADRLTSEPEETKRERNS
jgi:single-stranded DNA-binding protein